MEIAQVLQSGIGARDYFWLTTSSSPSFHEYEGINSLQYYNNYFYISTEHNAHHSFSLLKGHCNAILLFLH